MGILVVGDVHDYYFTFKEFLDSHWNPEEDIVMQLGYLINMGLHSVDCLELAMETDKKDGKRAMLLMGGA